MDKEIHYSKGYRIPLSVELMFKKGQLQVEDTIKACKRFKDMGILAEDYDAIDERYQVRDPLEVEEELEIFKNALATLPAKRWVVLRRRYIEGQTLKEIAQEIGRTRECVRLILIEIEKHLAKKCRGYATVGE